MFPQGEKPKTRKTESHELLSTYLVLYANSDITFYPGGCPYPDIEVLDLINKLENGYRMEKPAHISDKL